MSEITITHVQHGAQLLDYTLVGEDDTESMSADDEVRPSRALIFAVFFFRLVSMIFILNRFKDLFSEYKSEKGQFEADSVTSDDSLVPAKQAGGQGQQQAMSSPMFIAYGMEGSKREEDV